MAVEADGGAGRAGEEGWQTASVELEREVRARSWKAEIGSSRLLFWQQGATEGFPAAGSGTAFGEDSSGIPRKDWGNGRRQKAREERSVPS